MPLHDAKCECGWEGQVFFQPKAGIESLACDKCGKNTLAVCWSKTLLRPKWERTWDDRTGASHEHSCHPSLVAGYRKRLGEIDPEAANMLRENGDVVFHSRRDSRRFNAAAKKCQQQDIDDLERLRKQGEVKDMLKI